MNKNLVKNINSNQDLKAWAVTFVCYLFVFIFNPWKPLLIDESRTYSQVLFYIAVVCSLYYSFLHIQKYLTGKDVWKNINFGMINDVSELKEGQYKKKIRKLLTVILIILCVVILIPVIIMLVLANFIN